MAGRAQPDARRVSQELRGAGPDEVGVGGPQAHHDDVGAACHAQPLNGLFDVETVAWLAGAFSTSDFSGVKGVSTDALTGTHVPYRGSSSTEAWRSAFVIAVCVAWAPTSCTACSTIGFAVAYGVGVRLDSSSTT